MMLILTESYWQYLSVQILSNKHNLFKNKTGEQAFATALIFRWLLKDKAPPAANRGQG